jgi:glycyl-tRNA synthetase alpha chain
LRHREELELSHYSFNLADISFHRSLFDFHEKEGLFLLKEHGHFISAYEQMLKMSHAFNVLDARGAVSASERPGLIKRVRDLASGCAQAYLLHHFPPAAP